MKWLYPQNRENREKKKRTNRGKKNDAFFIILVDFIQV
jgi:hypothetical protein